MNNNPQRHISHPFTPVYPLSSSLRSRELGVGPSTHKGSHPLLTIIGWFSIFLFFVVRLQLSLLDSPLFCFGKTDETFSLSPFLIPAQNKVPLLLIFWVLTMRLIYFQVTFPSLSHICRGSWFVSEFSISPWLFFIVTQHPFATACGDARFPILNSSPQLVVSFPAGFSSLDFLFFFPELNELQTLISLLTSLFKSMLDFSLL